MLRTLPQTRDYSQVYRLAGVAAFTLITILSAKVSIEIGGPVPFTLQTLAVMLAGMVLGARDGALSQITYVALLVAGLPYDSRGLGTAALFGPTGGFIIGFIGAAWLTGALVEKGETRFWQRWLAGVVGIAVIYFFGVIWLRIYGGWVFPNGMTWEAAWAAGVAPFLFYDLLKAVLAAGISEGGRSLLLRYLPREF